MVAFACQIALAYVIFVVMMREFVVAHVFAASEAALTSKSGKGKLDESQGRKASGLHDQGHLLAGLPSKCVQVF